MGQLGLLKNQDMKKIKQCFLFVIGKLSQLNDNHKNYLHISLLKILLELNVV